MRKKNNLRKRNDWKKRNNSAGSRKAETKRVKLEGEGGVTGIGEEGSRELGEGVIGIGLSYRGPRNWGVGSLELRGQERWKTGKDQKQQENLWKGKLFVREWQKGQTIQERERESIKVSSKRSCLKCSDCTEGGAQLPE